MTRRWLRRKTATNPPQPHWINWSHVQDGITSQVNHVFRAVVGHPE